MLPKHVWKENVFIQEGRHLLETKSTSNVFISILEPMLEVKLGV